MTDQLSAGDQQHQHLLHLSELARSLADELAGATACAVPSAHTSRAPVVKAYMRARARRDRMFGADVFADPVWDILLDLYASTLENRRVSVSSACIASKVPPTTALRWLRKMEECGLIVRLQDGGDARRVFVELSTRSAGAMEQWVDGLSGELSGLVRGG